MKMQEVFDLEIKLKNDILEQKLKSARNKNKQNAMFQAAKIAGEMSKVNTMALFASALKL